MFGDTAGEGSIAELSAQASLGDARRLGNCTLASFWRFFPTLLPPDIVIRMGVAMVTGEVT